MADRKDSGKTVHSVALIGCGKMGSLWDEGVDLAAPALTHAHAIAKTSGLGLKALCDINPARLQEALANRKVSLGFSDISEMLKAQDFDVAVLATSTSVRLAAAQALIRSPIRVLVLEKPVASTLDEGLKVAQVLGDAGLKVVVNYLRRWDKELRSVRQRIADGEFGVLQKAVGLYSKGLCNNGSHQIDLMNFIFSAPLRARSLGFKIEEGSAFAGDDESLDAEIIFKTKSGEASFFLHAADQRAYTVFELDLFFSGGRVRMTDSGRAVETWVSRENPKLAGYRELQSSSKTSGGLNQALEEMYAEVSDLASGAQRSETCSLDDGLLALRVVDAIRKSHKIAKGEFVALSV